MQGVNSEGQFQGRNHNNETKRRKEHIKQTNTRQWFKEKEHRRENGSNTAKKRKRSDGSERDVEKTRKTVLKDTRKKGEKQKHNKKQQNVA